MPSYHNYQTPIRPTTHLYRPSHYSEAGTQQIRTAVPTPYSHNLTVSLCCYLPPLRHPSTSLSFPSVPTAGWSGQDTRLCTTCRSLQTTRKLTPFRGTKVRATYPYREARSIYPLPLHAQRCSRCTVRARKTGRCSPPIALRNPFTPVPAPPFSPVSE